MFGLILGIIFVLAAIGAAAYCYVTNKEERAADENGYYLREVKVELDRTRSGNDTLLELVKTLIQARV